MGNIPAAPSKSKARRLLKDVDKNCRQAAIAITQADVFIVTTGAGFSADSGLAIYRDVAKVPAYKERGVDYGEAARVHIDHHNRFITHTETPSPRLADLCVPEWLESEPEFYWGFWCEPSVKFS